MRDLKWVALLAAALSTACSAADRGSMDACGDASDASRAIAACSALLAADGLDKAEREQALFNRGQAYDIAGQADAALADFEAAIETLPESANGYGARGTMLARQGRLDQALPDFERALARDPNNIYALMNRGTVFEKRGDYTRALADYDRALVLAPGHPNVLDGRCWVRAVVGDLEGAVADCTAAMDYNNAPNLYNSRGFAYFKMRHYAEAVSDYDASIAGAPEVGSSWYMRGLARRALGDKAAQADIDRGLALEPGVARRYAGYGVKAD